MRFLCILLLLSFAIISCSEFSDSEYSESVSQKGVIAPPIALNWSPDGEWIVFLEYGAMQLMKADNRRDITPISGTGGYTNPVWSPDGQWIAYVHNPPYFTSDIWVKTVHQDKMPILITSNKLNDSSPSWSPDGTMIAFQSIRMNNWDIWVKQSDGSGLAIQFTSHSASDKNPVWSPKGDEIAFLSNRSGSYDIWVKSVDGTTPPRQITNTFGFEEEIKWSPDGRAIAYRSSSRNSSIWVQDVTGDESEIQINASEEVSSYDWSPDGFFLIYQAGDFIMTQRADGTGSEIKIAEGREPLWSPDGQKIAYVKFTGERYIIEVIDVPQELNKL